MVVELLDWIVVHASTDPYCPPELGGIALKGTVKGHPKKRDGQLVRTTRIKKVEGRMVLTDSGTLYRLGEPLPDYRKWAEENHPPFDPENPIRVKIKGSSDGSLKDTLH